MISNFNFRNLFVLDVANNHQGSVEHGLRIIREVSDVTKKHRVRAGLKFQFRQLDTFIHRSHRENKDNKHISRFLSTELSRDEFQSLLDEVRQQELLSICTPFDEESVDIIADMKFDILKIASCSAADWPLIEKACNSGLPIIFSTGGMDVRQVDRLVSFCNHRGVDFAIMHCVSIYPIPNDLFFLNQIDRLRNRFPEQVIGWSTHEDPNDTVPIGLALAKGASMFERHIGVETDEIKLNAYSSTPDQIDIWLHAYKKAALQCGENSERPIPTVEKDSLDSLRRGVYASKAIKLGTALSKDNIMFAMPYMDGQLESGQWPTEGQGSIVAQRDVEPYAPIMPEDIQQTRNLEHHVIKEATHEVRAMLNEARIHLNSEFSTEYSHHYGISNFRQTGAIIIDCVNREYCKKLIIQMPGQHHPSHYHAKKEETFQILYGTLNAEVDGHKHTLQPGETILIQPGVWHSFGTESGVIFEEISTTHYNDDSYYKDKAINSLKRSERKTMVDHWGRFQL